MPIPLGLSLWAYPSGPSPLGDTMLVLIMDLNLNDAPHEEGEGVADYSRGRAFLRAQSKILPQQPGVYRMIGADGEILYVGKARYLAKRVASYSQTGKLSSRMMQMVSLTTGLDMTVTHSEVEALLLESNLIKQHKPRFNILLKDDKSFAHILITGAHAFPQITKHRGAQKRKGSYFGPFASTGAVNRTVSALARAFLLRNCSDNIFATRSRPCLQYQIKRCTAPCVGLVSAQEYAVQVENACQFLSGQSQKVQRDYATKMQEAADRLDYETAALWRNRIRALTAIQANQDINMRTLKDADIIALSRMAGQSCIQIFFVRGGANYGNAAYFPHHTKEADDSDILSAFIGQFYDERVPPPLILVSGAVAGVELLAQAFALRTGKKCEISTPKKGGRRQIMQMAQKNAEDALARKSAEQASQQKILENLAQIFDMAEAPHRIEIYDNSHIQGAHAVGAMVVAGEEGFVKSAYRKFNMKIDAHGDDLAMMKHMIFRRFERALKEDPDRLVTKWPDLVLIDGGQGQLNAVCDVMEHLGLRDITIVAIAKGPERHKGRERFFMKGRKSFSLPDESTLYFLQRLRDEAHRFVIGAHRAKRKKQAFGSVLDEIPNIGAKRKKALLAHFGSAKAVAAAGVRDLKSVDGISQAIAIKIYDWFHQSAS